jgi:hypothetical protein
MSAHRITRGMIAAAHRELETIRELYPSDRAAFRYHAYSASGYIAVVRDTGQPLPVWLVRDWGYFRAMGWRGDAPRVAA